MMGQGESYVGIDVAKAGLDVGTWPEAVSLRVGKRRGESCAVGAPPAVSETMCRTAT